MLGRFALTSLGPDPHASFAGDALAVWLLEELINRAASLESGLDRVIQGVPETPNDPDYVDRLERLAGLVETFLHDVAEASVRGIHGELFAPDSQFEGHVCSDNAVRPSDLVECGADWTAVKNPADLEDLPPGYRRQMGRGAVTL